MHRDFGLDRNYRYYNPNYIISAENVRNPYLRLYYQ